jgi:hypothetical protein
LGLVFLVTLMALYNGPIMVSAVPVLGELFVAGWMALASVLVPVFGGLLGLTEPIAMSVADSGDSLWSHVQLFGFAVISAFVALVAAALDRGRIDHARLYAGLRVFLRYALALAMFRYGFAKLVGSQFMAPNPITLSRTYGDSSPMGLLWTFMGYSPAYQAFTGLAEIAAGVLLLSRRTTALGSLLACGVLANVVMLNLCYDVPVKQFSAQLLLIAVILVLHDAGRLVDVFVRNRPVAAEPDPPGPGRTRQRAAWAAKGAFVTLVVVNVVRAHLMTAEMQAQAVRGPLYGAWEVEFFALDGEERRLRPDDAVRWRQLVIPAYPWALVRPVRGDATAFGYAYDETAGRLTLTEHRDGEAHDYVLRASQPTPDQLVLSGPIAQGDLHARLWRVPDDTSVLMARTFRWIQEGNFNR